MIWVSMLIDLKKKCAVWEGKNRPSLPSLPRVALTTLLSSADVLRVSMSCSASSPWEPCAPFCLQVTWCQILAWGFKRTDGFLELGRNPWNVGMLNCGYREIIQTKIQHRIHKQKHIKKRWIAMEVEVWLEVSRIVGKGKAQGFSWSHGKS